jgi:hypothetical protein
MFLFLSLAIVKRFAELENLRASGATPKTAAATCWPISNSCAASAPPAPMPRWCFRHLHQRTRRDEALSPQAALLWLIVPLMILWLNRVWLLASRGELDEDPVAFA